MPEPGSSPSPPSSAAAIGPLLREWRGRRRLSQLTLALEAGVSSRHLSFVETGRAQPSRDMVLLLAERLQVPFRERNRLLLSAGFAPVFPQRSLDDPALKEARRAVEIVLSGHEPYPALAVDRHWDLVLANRAVAPLLEGVAPELLQPKVNVLRLSLHPKGLAGRIVNLGEWRQHVLSRLRHQIDLSADPVLDALRGELAAYPVNSAGSRSPREASEAVGVVVPFQLATVGGVLSFFTTTTVFGTPIDISLSELAIEAFFPANAETAARLRAAADA